MTEASVIFNIAVIFIAALIGGLIAETLRQSPLIGYILGGILAGPYVSGAINEQEIVQGFADIGVILLMFTLGIEFSLTQLSRVKKVAVGGGLLQIALLVLIVVVLGQQMGLSVYQSLFLGCALSISSTMIVLRVLGDQGELSSVYGQIMIGILIVQDLAVVLMVSVLPRLHQFSYQEIPHLLATLSIAALLILMILLLAPRIIPMLLEKAAQGSNNDIFLLLALSLGLGVALLAQAVGLSVSLGAFLAGLIITESDYAHEMLGKIVSLRDAFVILFFVSVGMMVNPQTLFQNWSLLIMALVIIIPLKFCVFFIIMRLFGYQTRIAFYVGMGMMQTGEFSFVMAKIGLDKQLIAPTLYNVILASTLISILLTPLFFKVAPGLYKKLQKIRWLAAIFKDPEIDLQGYTEKELSGHVIVCGYGRAGYQVGNALQQLQVPYMVIEYDHTAISKLKAQQIPYIYGDAANELVLKHAFPEQASLAILALPDIYTNQQVIRGLKKYNQDIKILGRAQNYWEKKTLYEAGAWEVIQPEEEAGLQMVRHMILHLHLDPESVVDYLENLYFKDYHEIMHHQVPFNKDKEPLKIRSYKLHESPLSGSKLRDSGIREASGCSVVTIKKNDGEVIINPHSNECISNGDTLIVMGSNAQLNAFASFILPRTNTSPYQAFKPVVDQGS